MKRYSVILLAIAFLALAGFGCSAQNKQKDVVAKINDYEIRAQEFEEAFKNSSYARQDTIEARKEFLDSLIDQKLILQEAQKKGLDREEGFLKAIERFWEQSLLKIALDAKTKEIANSFVISDLDVKEAYDKLPDAGKLGKSYQDLYSQLKWKLAKERETIVIDIWLTGLRKNAAITVNYKLLKKEK